MTESKDVIRDLAHRAVLQTPVIQDAVEIVLKEINANGLKAQLQEQLMRRAVRQAVDAARHNNREGLKIGEVRMPGECERGDEELYVLGQAGRDRFLRIWCIGDKYLADCTIEEVRAERERDRTKADGYLANVAFYDQIIKRANGKDDKRVEEVISDEQAEQLWRKYGDAA